MSRQFLLDGYNLIHKMPQLAQRGLEDARRGLITYIGSQQPQGSAANSVTVVFDGRDDVYHLPEQNEVRVLFSRGEKADDLIKRIISESTSVRTLVLVTDDRELQDFARACGAGFMMVSAFVACGRQRREQRIAGSAQPGAGKLIPEVFKNNVNRELELLWLKGRKGRRAP